MDGGKRVGELDSQNTKYKVMSVFLNMPGKGEKGPVEFLTIKEMAALCGNRGTHSFMKLIKRGLMPDANYRTEGTVIGTGERVGTEVQGARLYSKNYLAPKLIEIFKTVYQGKKLTMDQRQKLAEAFTSEKKYFETEY